MDHSSPYQELYHTSEHLYVLALNLCYNLYAIDAVRCVCGLVVEGIYTVVVYSFPRLLSGINNTCCT